MTTEQVKNNFKLWRRDTIYSVQRKSAAGSQTYVGCVFRFGKSQKKSRNGLPGAFKTKRRETIGVEALEELKDTGTCDRICETGRKESLSDEFLPQDPKLGICVKKRNDGIQVYGRKNRSSGFLYTKVERQILPEFELHFYWWHSLAHYVEEAPYT